MLAIQLVGLISLSPGDFGTFSIQYLLFAFGASVSLSVISDAWIRTDVVGGQRSSWRQYSSVSLYLALTGGLLTLTISFAIEPLRPVAVTGAVAVVASLYRGSVRYYSLRLGENRGVLPGDLLGLAGTMTTWTVALFFGYAGLEIVVLAWAVGALCSAVASRRPTFAAPRTTIATWWTTHRRSIRPLLRDSLLMDLSAIGTPYLLAPVLGLAQFGIYRAISNIAAPVRLILNPLRPLLSSAPIEVQRSRTRLGLVTLVAVALGGCAYLILWLFSASEVEIGTLNGVAAFAAPAAVFISANFVGHFYYIVARAHLRNRDLLFGRIAQTVLAIAGPIAGVWTNGLPGAIWGYATCTLVSAAVWALLVNRLKAV